MFAHAGGITAVRIAKWDGSSWSALGSGIDNQVRALAVSGNDVYAGGYFATGGGAAAINIAKWDGSIWSALGSGMGGGGYLHDSVFTLAASGSDLYAGGNFTTAGGKPSKHIARAYMLPLPALSLSLAGSSVMVSWPSPGTDGFALEQAASPSDPANWVSNTVSITDDGTNKSFTVPATDGAQFFFRLLRP